ncbi:MAG: histidine phosphatase family protein [Candidatus Abyssubacteria bacterium]
MLRHGESTANAGRIFASHRLDAPLSENGVGEARDAARFLERFPITALYSSTVLRARQTAEIVAEHLKLEPVFMPGLVEIDVGHLEGKSQDLPEYWREYETVVSLWDRGFDHKGFVGGETLAEVRERLEASLEQVHADGAGHVLLVGHCLLFMALIWFFCDNHGPSLEDGHMGRAHVSILHSVSRTYRLERFNIKPPSE